MNARNTISTSTAAHRSLGSRFDGRRLALVLLAGSLTVATAACQIGGSENASVRTAGTASATPVADVLPGSVAPVVPTDVLPTDPTPVAKCLTCEDEEKRTTVDFDPAPVVTLAPPDSVAPIAPVVVIVQQQPAPQPRPVPTPAPTTAAPTTPAPSTPAPTEPPTVTMPTTTTPPTTAPVGTAPPYTLPPVTMPVAPPISLEPPYVPSYLVTVSAIGLKAGTDCVEAGKTSVFVEGDFGVDGAPHAPIGTYIGTANFTEVGEPGYTIVDQPGTRAVFGHATYTLNGVANHTSYFNVRDVGTTTVREHLSLAFGDGRFGTCHLETSYVITVSVK